MADVGRPTIYNNELAERFLKRIANGRSLRDVCADADMPCRQTIATWRKQNPDFLAQYDIAVEDRGDFLFEQTLEIVDNAELDKESIAKARLQMDARKWFLSKLLPKRFGDKIADAEIDTNDGEITINVRRVGKNAD